MAWRTLAQFQDPLIYLLLAAVAISLVAWAIEGREGWPVDALVIALIVVLNAVLGYSQEAKAESAVAALARMTAVTSAVVRDGQELRVPSAELVRGDVLVLAEGDAVGADARLLEAAALRVQEASLTGESEAVLKDAATLKRRRRSATASTWCSRAPRSRRGPAAPSSPRPGWTPRWARIAAMLEATEEEPTPLQKEVGRIGRMLGIAVVVIAVVVVGDHPAGLRHPQRRRRRHGAAARRVARGGGRARGPAGDPVGRARARRAADGQAQRHRQEALVGGDPGLGLGDLLGQDRHADALGDDDRAGDDRLGRHPRHRRRLRARGPGRARGGELAAGPLHAEDIVVLSGGSLAGNADLRRRRTASGRSRAIRPKRRSWSRSASSARPNGASGASSESREIPFTSERKMMSTIELDHEHGDDAS